MTRPAKVAVIVGSGIAVPFILAYIINALYQLCLGFGWAEQGAAIFASVTAFVFVMTAWVASIMALFPNIGDFAPVPHPILPPDPYLYREAERKVKSP